MMKDRDEMMGIGDDGLAGFFLSLDVTNDGAWVLDLENGSLQLSANALKMLGYENSEIIGSEVICNYFFHEDSREAVHHKYTQITKGHTDIVDIESKVRMEPNGWKWIRMRGKVITRDEKSSPRQLIGIYHDISDQKQISEELLRCRKDFKSFFENNAVGLAIHKPDNSLIDFNPGLCQMLGYEKKELIKMSWKELIHPEDSIKVSGPINDILGGKSESFSTEVRVVCKDGSIVYTTLSTICFRYESGSVRHFLSSVVNTSRLHAYKDSIIQYQIILRTIIDNLPMNVYIIDKNGRKVMSNKADWESIGYSSEYNVLGKTDIDLFPGEIGERFHADNMYVIENKTPILNKEEFFVDNEGNQKWLMTSKIPLSLHNNNDKQISWLVGIGVDVTEQRKLRQQIIESEAYYRTLIDTSPDGIFVTDIKGKVTFLSKKVYQIFKVPDTVNLIGESIFDWLAPESLEAGITNFKDVIESNRIPQTREFKCTRFDKSEFWGEFSYSPLLDSSDNLAGLMIVCRDITERKRIEEDLISAKNKAEESDKLKTALLRNISHEIRTPLNGIIGFSSLLGKPELTLEMTRSYVDSIQTCSDQLLSIITDLIDISSIEAKIINLNKSQVDLDQLLKDIWNQYQLRAQSRNLNLIFNEGLPGEGLSLYTDKTKLQQIISNLLSNAIKFTLSGQIEFGYTTNNSEAVFYVSDTGIGIPPDYHTRIFDTFFQVESVLSRKFVGTGLGLSICKAYVELLKGRIWVESEPGKGSTFFFTIPFEPDISSKQNRFSGLNGQKLLIKKPVTILVAEDDDNISFLIQKMLADPFIKIISVRNGVEAVSMCKKMTEIDLVFMDLNMPQMDGYDATLKIRENFPDLPVIAQTAYMIDSEQASEYGFTDYILKPFSKSDLILKINKYLLNQKQQKN